MKVEFRDSITTERKDEKQVQLGKIDIDITKCEGGIQGIQLYRSSHFMGAFFHLYSVDEWDRLKAKVDRMIARAEEYNIT